MSLLRHNQCLMWSKNKAVHVSNNPKRRGAIDTEGCDEGRGAPYPLGRIWGGGGRIFLLFDLTVNGIFVISVKLL